MTTIPLPDDSIAAIFAADPTSLSDAEFNALITEFRRRRNVFASEEAAASLKAKKSKPTPTPVDPAMLDKPASEVSLEDLLG